MDDLKPTRPRPWLLSGMIYREWAEAEIIWLLYENEQLQAERDNLQMQAEGQAQEMRTQKAIVQNILQFVSGGHGEPGDWRAEEYVRQQFEQLRAERDEARREAEFIRTDYASVTNTADKRLPWESDA